MEELICKKCGCKEVKYYVVGPHIGAYCAHCDNWIKWVRKASNVEIERKEVAVEMPDEERDESYFGKLPWE